MKFEKVEVSVFDAAGTPTKEKKLRWELNTTEGRFTAPEWMTKEQIEAAMNNGSFSMSSFKTADQRPVFTILARKVVDSFETKTNIIKVRKEGSAAQLESCELTYVD